MANLENALQIPGWTNPAELQWLAEQAQQHLRIAEIGSWKGRSTRALADNVRRGGSVWAVDTWKGTAEDGHSKELDGKPESWLLDEFFRNTRGPFNIHTCQLPSTIAAKNFGEYGVRFDMIFIDAAHDYDNVKADILAWRPLLRPGGLLCGHDYDAGRPGVVKAVRELIPERGRAAGSIWVAR